MQKVENERADIRKSAEAIEQAPDGQRRFAPCEVGAEAVVDAAAERERLDAAAPELQPRSPRCWPSP